MFIKLIFITLFVFSYSLKASEVTIIELHKNKSLDQLVLEKENNIENNNLEENFDNNDSGNEDIEVLSTSDEDNSENNQDESDETIILDDKTSVGNGNSEAVILINSENIFDILTIICTVLFVLNK